LTSRNPPTLGAWLDLFCELAEVVRKAALGSFEERDDVRIDELVADASALFVPSHDSGSLQDAEICETFCCVVSSEPTNSWTVIAWVARRSSSLSRSGWPSTR